MSAPAQFYYSSGNSVGSPPPPAAPVEFSLVAGVPPINVEKPVASKGKKKPKGQSIIDPS